MASPSSLPSKVDCPICKASIPATLINAHLDSSCSRYTASDPAMPTLKRANTSELEPSSGKRRVSHPLESASIAQSSSLQKKQKPPLAERQRPKDLSEYTGQDELMGPKGLLRRLIEHDSIPSMILWGPPGTGKTTLAKLIAKRTKAHFQSMSAITSGIADVKKILESAKGTMVFTGKRTILFMDEVLATSRHRFNRTQQDVFLPYVESGDITLIGATTENPSFKLNAALLSRCRVFPLQALSSQDIQVILQRAKNSLEEEVVIEDDVIIHLADMSSGDARVALNALEMAVDGLSSAQTLTKKDVEDALKRAHSLYDRAGDKHYGMASAFIKSMRGSDPDAALYWLHRALQGGEDPLFLARRMVIFASEDVGLADNKALPMAVAAQQATMHVGLPEAEYALSHAAVYLASAPKSVRVTAAMKRVKRALKEHGPLDPPPHIVNAPTALMKSMGHGVGYLYPPDYQDDPEALAGQTYLPDALIGETFLDPPKKHHSLSIDE
ncbi:recombination factor protein rara [Piptocephalis cylindrospora]|uniref:Recombination factor protein rara n=1 Tax=Piptocephalis cylindrospora TaxID=1907219 RepID=A0A4P9Y3S4_9FUNG|nr:recombination factor protein rara [Piptocephalis cylindrospora]|eukprot:RKP13302.1 recombination factor protein rara [Piptocephalis cylindrospora]